MTPDKRIALMATVLIEHATIGRPGGPRCACGHDYRLGDSIAEHRAAMLDLAMSSVGGLAMSGDLITERVAREREWAVTAFDARLTYPEMRRLVGRPPEDGGLGYDLSLSALKGLVEQGRAARGDLAMSKADRRERQQAELDGLARAARADFDAARRMLGERRPTRDDFYSYEDYLSALQAWAKSQDVAGKMIENAHRRLDGAHKREAALHGLDEPTKIEAEVTHRDAVVDELNEALARLDPKHAEHAG